MYKTLRGMSTCMFKSIWLTSFVISMNLGQKVVETALDSHFDVISSVLCFRLYLLTNVHYTALQILILILNGMYISPKTWNTPQVLIYGHISNPNTLICTNPYPQQYLIFPVAIVYTSFTEKTFYIGTFMNFQFSTI